jgi:hypothetical protein
VGKKTFVDFDLEAASAWRQHGALDESTCTLITDDGKLWKMHLDFLEFTLVEAHQKTTSSLRRLQV